MTQFLHDFVQKHVTRLTTSLLIVGACLSVVWLQTGSFPQSTVSTLQSTTFPLAGFTVALDPGHGGYDGGARAVESQLWEKDINLDIALAVEKALLEQGATVVLTRRTDMDFADDDGASSSRKQRDLQARVDIALEANADVFLSIHLNEYRDRNESGPHVFYQQGGDDGRLLSGFLQEALISTLNPTRERVAQAGNYYVLRSSIPSALVECGFLSNAEEEAKLLTPSYQALIGQAIAQGLAEYRFYLEAF